MTGYSAQNTVSAKAKIAGAGALVDAAVGAGANTVDGPSLTLSDEDALYRDALEQAVENARAKALALAHAGGFGVGPVSTVVEQGAAAQPVFDSAVALAKGTSTPDRAGDARRHGRCDGHVHDPLARDAERQTQGPFAARTDAAGGPLRSAMCTGNGFSHVHHSGVGSFNAPAMTAVLSLLECPAG